MLRYARVGFLVIGLFTASIQSSLYAMWETVASLRREVADLESSCESLRFATAERALLHRMVFPLMLHVVLF